MEGRGTESEQPGRWSLVGWEEEGQAQEAGWLGEQRSALGVGGGSEPRCEDSPRWGVMTDVPKTRLNKSPLGSSLTPTPFS